jgi:hypothetical protein
LAGVEPKPATAANPEHSTPPVVDHHRKGASSKSSPGHLADEEDVYVLPAAVKSKVEPAPKTVETTPAPKKAPEPPKDANATKPAASAPPLKPSAPSLDRITLPDEPPPPKSLGPSNIQLPN